MSRSEDTKPITYIRPSGFRRYVCCPFCHQHHGVNWFMYWLKGEDCSCGSFLVKRTAFRTTNKNFKRKQRRIKAKKQQQLKRSS